MEGTKGMTDLEWFRAHYNAMAELLGLPKCVKLTEARRKALQARIREHGEDGVCQAIEALRQSAFLAGANDRGWRANWDFVMQPSSMVKLLEGAYTSATVTKVSNRERLKNEWARENAGRSIGVGSNQRLPYDGADGGRCIEGTARPVDNSLDRD